MTDIYGDRRCPTCQSIKETTESACWNCDRAEAFQRELADKLATAVAKHPELRSPNVPMGPFVPGRAETTFELKLADVPPMRVVADPAMEPDTFEIRQISPVVEANLAATQKLWNGAVPARMASIEQMEAVMLRVRAFQCTDLRSDAVQLARWLKDAIQEIAELRTALNKQSAQLSTD